MIKNIIFDLGRVIINFEPKDIIKNFCTDDDTVKQIDKEIFENPEWVMMDAGAIDEKTFLKNAKQRLPSNIEKLAEKVFLNWHKYLNYIPETAELIYALKDSGYKIYLLSNIGERAHEIVKDNPFFDVFDDCIFSCDVKMIKPDIKIFEYAAQKFGVKPSESIFVDDMKNNIESANNAGFNGIVFKNAIDAGEQIKKIIRQNRKNA